MTDPKDLIERLNEWVSRDAHNGYSKTNALIEEAATALEAMVADAERYKWFRRQSTYRYDCGMTVLNFDDWIKVKAPWPTQADEDGIAPTPPTAFDAAIDRERG